MLTNINITGIYVLDQDEALDFYVGKLGLEVGSDVDMGFMRWLTIHLPGDPDHQLLLEVPGRSPAHSAETAAQLRDLVTKGAMGAVVIFNTDDCEKLYEELSAKGVEFTDKPTKQPYGIDCAFRDPFGNHIRATQRVQGPVEVTDEDIARWSGA